MAIQTPGAFFLGTLVPSEQKFIKIILENALKAGYNKVVEPCAGAFAMSHLAVQAGFKPEQIEASDVTMFSSIMGYAIMQKPLDDLEITAKGFTKEEMSDYSKALYALLYLKTMKTAGSDFFYAMLKDMEERKDIHIQKIKEQMDRASKLLKGFSYRPLDMFDHIDEVYNDPKAIIIANPPTYASGFEKWYDTGGNMNWKEPEYRIFDPNTGLKDLFAYMDKSKALLICYEENKPRLAAGKPIFSRYGVRKGYNVYLTTNNEEEAVNLATGKIIVRGKESVLSPLNCSTLPTDYVITSDSKVHFQAIEPENSQYYRGIWTHNYVGSAAQINVGLFVDKYLAGVFGYQIAIGGKVMYDILIMYGVAIPHVEYRMNRLLTMIAQNKETLKTFLNDIQLDRLTGVMTTQMTKYPESKEMRGIMKLVSKDKGKLGYKLIYKSQIHERTKQETLAEWLKKETAWKTEREKSKNLSASQKEQ